MRYGTMAGMKAGIGISVLSVALAACGSASGPETPSPEQGPGVDPAATATGSVAPGRQVAPEEPRWDPNFITREQIRQSGARNGMDALKYNARHITINDGVDHLTGQIQVQHRGPDSLAADDSLLLVVNGVIMRDFSRLRDIPANMIGSIEIVRASQATLRFGLDAGGGAIVVTTTTSGGY